MKVLFQLERIGDDAAVATRHYNNIISMIAPRQYAKSRMLGGFPIMPSVRKFTKEAELGEYLKYRKDYSSSNGAGSRGVMAIYELDMGHYYWVRDRVSWKRCEEYFICAGRTGVRKVSKEEAVEWARERLA